VPVGWRTLRVGDFGFDPLATRLCPSADGVTTGPVRLTGRSGGAPLVLTAASTRYGFDGRIAVERLEARLGAGDDATRLAIARLDAIARPGGRLSGRVAELSGQIARVPLLVSAGQGPWTFERGTLSLRATAAVRDAAEPARFLPMRATDVRVQLRGGQVTASGTIAEPVTGRRVTSVAIDHDLTRGSGAARLVVDALSFGRVLMPLTKGLVANVEGRIDGRGDIAWTPRGVVSTGRFRTDALDFAAAFGPVTGAAGEVVFDDLLALSTPPGQRVRLASVNPGVEVNGGEIVYRLRPGQQVEIEDGRWPFAGGELRLEPAVLNFAREGTRRLVFRVVGLDAALFIERLKLQDVAATGIFDGALPVVFGTNEGRVEGGQLVARGPGTLSYVGDVSNAQTNAMSRLAFDALKSIRYQNLAIELDGALDGEIVSRVRFTGTNQAPVAPSGLIRAFTGLPFRFNIVVRAPFRGLVNTARSLQDPGLLVQPLDSGIGEDAKPR
jgi:translocation and assembly module TamB